VILNRAADHRGRLLALHDAVEQVRIVTVTNPPLACGAPHGPW
jgi:hypothetical protein